MQDISSHYRKLMRAGSIVSLCLLGIGLTLGMFEPYEVSKGWSWRSGHLYLMLGIVTLLLTPIAGLITFFIYNIKNRQYPMAFLALILLGLLAGGTWLIHPGN